MKSNQKVAVVTGSSSGIGYETSLTLARNGFLTYATMRNLNNSKNIKLVATKENINISSPKHSCMPTQEEADRLGFEKLVAYMKTPEGQNFYYNMATGEKLHASRI
jgi:NAD(P)-dependent dehydrogenase (short-subunit alcohol dehydrogenase family)